MHWLSGINEQSMKSINEINEINKINPWINPRDQKSMLTNKQEVQVIFLSLKLCLYVLMLISMVKCEAEFRWSGGCESSIISWMLRAEDGRLAVHIRQLPRCGFQEIFPRRLDKHATFDHIIHGRESRKIRMSVVVERWVFFDIVHYQIWHPIQFTGYQRCQISNSFHFVIPEVRYWMGDSESMFRIRLEAGEERESFFLLWNTWIIDFLATPFFFFFLDDRQLVVRDEHSRLHSLLHSLFDFAKFLRPFLGQPLLVWIFTLTRGEVFVSVIGKHRGERLDAWVEFIGFDWVDGHHVAAPSWTGVDEIWMHDHTFDRTAAAADVRKWDGAGFAGHGWLHIVPVWHSEGVFELDFRNRLRNFKKILPDLDLFPFFEPNEWRIQYRYVCSGSVVVTAHDSESGRPGWNPFFYFL